MNVEESKLLKGVLQFLYEYQNPTVRDEINQRMASGIPYKGHPVFLYIQYLLIFSPIYRRYYTRFTKTSFLKRASKFIFRKSPTGTDQMENFLRYCYSEGRQEYRRLQNLTAPPGILSSSEIQTGQQISNLPDGPQKNFILSRYLAKLARSKSAPVIPYRETPPPKRLTSKQINAELEKYQQVSGKEIKYVPKIHPPLPEPEAVKKLDKLVGIEPEVRQPLVSVGGEILSKVKDVAVQVEIPTQRATSRVGPALVSMGGNILKTALGGGGKLALGLGGKGLGLIAGAATGPVGWAALGASLAGKPVKKIAREAAIIGAGIFLFIILLISTNLFQTTSLLPPPGVGEAAPLPTGPTPIPYPGGSGCPSMGDILANENTTPETCRYLNPSIDIHGDVTPQQVNAYVDAYAPKNEAGRADFQTKVNKILEKARQVGLNPIIAMGYWRSEGGFTNSFGCPRVVNEFDPQLNCATGISEGGSVVMQCASLPGKNQWREAGCAMLKSIILSHPNIYDRNLFKFDYNTTGYNPATEPDPVTTFDAIAEGHGSRSPNLVGVNGEPNGNCTSTYNILLEVILAAGACTVPPPPATASSCPIPNGQIICGSYFTPRNGCGHCDGGYGYTAQYCSSAYGGGAGYTGTESGLDIGGKDDQPFYLPILNGHNIAWTFVGQLAGTVQGIQKYVGRDTTTNEIYYIQFHHSEGGSGNPNAQQSGDRGGNICTHNLDGTTLCGQEHVHVQVSNEQGTWLDAANMLCK